MVGAMPETHTWSTESLLVHAGRPRVVPGDPVNVPIELSSTFYAGGDPEYARDGTRSMRALEEAIESIEGGSAVAFASGMAAANAILDLLRPGAIVVAAEFTYTGVALRLRELHERGAIELRLVDIADTTSVVAALTGADAVWI